MIEYLPCMFKCMGLISITAPHFPKKDNSVKILSFNSGFNIELLSNVIDVVES